MYATLEASGKLSAETDQGIHKVRGGATVVIGDGTAENFGGGTLNIIKYLEGGGEKILESHTSIPTLPRFIEDAGIKGVDVELIGATSPSLYVEIN